VARLEGWPFVISWLLLVIQTAAPWPAKLDLLAQSEQQRFRERVEVPRILIDVRVMDASGRAMPNLSASDFAVTIDGTTAKIDTVEWVPADAATIQNESTFQHQSRPGPTATNDRWIVFLYQKHPDFSDVEGFMALHRQIDNLTKVVGQHDHVAVLSFDTSLHYWLDFTSDTQRVRQVMNHDLIVAAPPAVGVEVFPALTARLSPETAAKTYSIEQSLQLLGASLEPLPGPKTIVVFGYGMGTWLRKFGIVHMDQHFGEMLSSLEQARVSVFCVDITKAEYHPREEGLRVVADETGGLYIQSYSAPVFDRLEGALAGYYVMFVVPPDAAAGERRIDVKVKRRRATVIAKHTYIAQ